MYCALLVALMKSSCPTPLDEEITPELCYFPNPARFGLVFLNKSVSVKAESPLFEAVDDSFVSKR